MEKIQFETVYMGDKIVGFENFFATVMCVLVGVIVVGLTIFFIFYFKNQKKYVAVLLPSFLDALKAEGYTYNCKKYHGTIFADDTIVHFTAGGSASVRAVLSNRVVSTYYYIRDCGKASLLVFLPYNPSEHNKDEFEKIISILRNS